MQVYKEDFIPLLASLQVHNWKLMLVTGHARYVGHASFYTRALHEFYAAEFQNDRK